MASIEAKCVQGPAQIAGKRVSMCSRAGGYVVFSVRGVDGFILHHSRILDVQVNRGGGNKILRGGAGAAAGFAIGGPVGALGAGALGAASGHNVDIHWHDDFDGRSVVSLKGLNYFAKESVLMIIAHAQSS